MNQATPKKTSPIIFQPWKIQKILSWDSFHSGYMQTRRIAKIPADMRDNLLQPFETGDNGSWRFLLVEPKHIDTFTLRSPYGSVGDYLWVKENWAARAIWDDYKPAEIVISQNKLAGSSHPLGAAIFYQTEDPNWLLPERGKLRTSLFMPHAASRIKLRIIEIHPERLWHIKESDAIPEGWDGSIKIPAHISDSTEAGRQWYFDLWDKLNGDKSPETSSSKNPWVWKITFEKAG